MYRSPWSAVLLSDARHCKRRHKGLSALGVAALFVSAATILVAEEVSPRTRYHATDFFPLAVGNYWSFDEVTPADGQVVAREGWTMVSEDGGVFHLTALQVPLDARSPTPGAPSTIDEYYRLGDDGVRKGFAPEQLQVLLGEPLELGTKWTSDAGMCTVTALGASVRTSVRTFDDCVEVVCRPSHGMDIRSSYARGVGLVRQEVTVREAVVGGPVPHLADADDRSAGRSVMYLRTWNVSAARWSTPSGPRPPKH